MIVPTAQDSSSKIILYFTLRLALLSAVLIFIQATYSHTHSGKQTNPTALFKVSNLALAGIKGSNWILIYQGCHYYFRKKFPDFL